MLYIIIYAKPLNTKTYVVHYLFINQYRITYTVYTVHDEPYYYETVYYYYYYLFF